MGLEIAASARLSVQRFDGADPAEAAFVLQLLNEPSFLRHIGDRGVRTLAQAHDYLVLGPLASYQRNGFGLSKVVSKETGEVLGTCGLVQRDSLPGPDLGYAFLPTTWGQGFAAEAAGLVLEHARRACGLARVLAITDAQNRRSIHLLHKLGFVAEGRVRLAPEQELLQLFARDLTR